jgi:DNA-3-methyladenine glycosylase II
VDTSGFAAATAALARRDPVIRRLMRRVGPCRLRRPESSAFAALTKAIIYQQLAGRAAAAIHSRFKAGLAVPLTPEAVLASSLEALRQYGLSGAKAASIWELSARVADGTVPLRGLWRLSDEEVVARLTTVRGIGRWTAEMFMIFQMRRPDVWPVSDYGVRSGYALAYGLPTPPPPRVLESLGERFRPFRTVGAWYCWRAVHLSRAG